MAKKIKQIESEKSIEIRNNRVANLRAVAMSESR